MPIPMSSYPRPAFDTGIGYHAGPNGAFPLGEFESGWQEWVNHIKVMGGSWLKLMAFGASALGVSQFLIANDIMPIVRLYRGGPNPGSMVDDDPMGRDAVAQYVAAGVKYMEVNNEPGLFSEWAGDLNHEGIPQTWQDWNPNQPTPVADSWVKDANWVLDHGGLPGIPAMAPGGNIDDQNFLSRFFDRIIATGNAGIMQRGVWLSVHPAGFNHPLDYPSDAVNQTGLQLTAEEYAQHEWIGTLDEVNANRRQGVNAGQTIMDPGASNGWRKWEMVEALFEQKFGFKVPVLCTEGGFWIGEAQDPRYWMLNQWDVSYLTRTTAEAIMNGRYPDWLFCTGYWLLADKGMGGSGMFEHQAMFTQRAGDSGQWPVVGNLKEMEIHARLPYQGDPDPPEPPSTQLTDAEIAEVTRQAGFTGSGWTTAVAIVLAESGGRTDAVNSDGNTPPSRDRGLWQLNDYWHSEVSDDCAFDALCSSVEAFRISDGGTYWGAWSAYNAGTYLDFWDRAEAVTCGSGPTAQELKVFAYEVCLGVPEESALMREGRRLGLVPLSGEELDMIGCAPIVGQVFGAGSRMVLLWCNHGAWDKVYQQEL